ncbi:hypothetical protein FD755_019289, partial [Muntiacus reevesi]
GCSGFSESVLKTLLSSCSRLDELNLSCEYRENLQRSDVSTLVGRCPSLVHLDFSDSVIWCFNIIPETLLEFGEIPGLKTLQIFGIVSDGTLQLLKKALPHLQVNCSHFATIARLTTGN